MGTDKPTGSESLSQLFINKSVVEKVLLQTEKDLYPYFDGERLTKQLDQLSFEEVRDNLGSAIKEIDKGSSGELRSVLYRVDVPEQEFIDKLGDLDYYGVLAEAILNRELKKVLFRLHYSQGDHSQN